MKLARAIKSSRNNIFTGGKKNIWSDSNTYKNPIPNHPTFDFALNKHMFQ